MSNPTIRFQALSWSGEDGTIGNNSDDTEKDERYVIRVFGKTLDGKNVAVAVRGFRPYFYIKVPTSDEWTSSMTKKLQTFVTSMYGGSTTEVVKRKDFYGFTNNAMFKFVRCEFATNKVMHFAAAKFKKVVKITGVCESQFKIYESNIDPYIRFLHAQEILPCGWIQIKKGTYRFNDDCGGSCDIDVSVAWEDVKPYECEKTAPFVIASFDIECTSATGDFPLAKKTYRPFAGELYDYWTSDIEKNFNDEYDRVENIRECFKHALGLSGSGSDYSGGASSSAAASGRGIGIAGNINIIQLKKACTNDHSLKVDRILNDVYYLLKGDAKSKPSRDTFIQKLDEIMVNDFPGVHGDSIIQIGTTMNVHGQRDLSFKHIVTLGGCDDIEGATVDACKTESELLIKWRKMIVETNPDIITGYNIFGFDFNYVNERAKELAVEAEVSKIGRFARRKCKFQTKNLSSSALGENVMTYYDMDGRVLIDVMKVVQRDHKLDTYKLDHVANHFIGLKKNDVSPQDIFRLQRGSDSDRAIVARYCIQDCALCNQLISKLEILPNNIGMSNVCLVPLSFIFLRGQGIKIFSLVMKQCTDDGFVIPVITPGNEADDETYEGAVVLDPKTGIYIDNPVTVFDFASLYPSSMISENLSHDSIVLDEKYKGLPGVEYLDIEYAPGKVATFVQPGENEEKGVIPRILMKLLDARKMTRKRCKLMDFTMKSGEVKQGFKGDFKDEDVVKVAEHYDEFQRAVLEGLQLAYKVTSNSLYGQTGARTSQISLKVIAAATTATGRKMIMMAKDFVESKYDGNAIYGDTDSIFVCFNDELKGKEAIAGCMERAYEISKEFKKLIKAPHDLQFEKVICPFILLRKKGYVGLYYTDNSYDCEQHSMGIVLKRRDNANIVKRIYGGVIDIILNELDVAKAVEFFHTIMTELVSGKIDIADLTITKALKSTYKNPHTIAHWVLSQRIGQRTPGNKPAVNERLGYVFVKTDNPKALQGERIETPSFIKEKELAIDYEFYITNQIMVPIMQLFAVVIEQLPGFNRAINYFELEKARLLEGGMDVDKVADKVQDAKEAYVKELLFDKYVPPKTKRRSKVDSLAGVTLDNSVELMLAKKKASRANVGLDDMLLTELRAHATRIDLPNRSKYAKKAELLAAIRDFKKD